MTSRRSLTMALAVLDSEYHEIPFSLLMVALVIRTESVRMRRARIEIRKLPSHVIETMAITVVMKGGGDIPFLPLFRLAVTLGLDRNHVHAIVDSLYSAVRSKVGSHD